MRFQITREIKQLMNCIPELPLLIDIGMKLENIFFKQTGKVEPFAYLVVITVMGHLKPLKLFTTWKPKAFQVFFFSFHNVQRFSGEGEISHKEMTNCQKNPPQHAVLNFVTVLQCQYPIMGIASEMRMTTWAFSLK